jgi:uncharacterized protein involved in outer membrane biogenesis
MRCTTPESCVVHFNLHANDLSLQRVNQLVNPAYGSQPWYHLLSLGSRHNDALLRLHADGSIAVSHLQLGPVMASNVAGQLQMNAGKVQLDIVRSDVLGGKNAGRWNADFTQSPPQYAGGGTVQKISMDQLSAAMKDSWAGGQLTGKYGLSLRGATAASLRDSITGSLDFTWMAGSLRHLALEGRPAPLSFASLAGVLTAHDRKLTCKDCKLNSAGTTFELSGAASFDRTLDFSLKRSGGPSYAISGSLEKPQVQALPSFVTQAQAR